MAYCPKCGVEVDDDVRNCPLCRFPVPDIRSASDPVSGQNMAEGRYPEPSNIYREHRQAIKNLAFFVFATIAVSAMIVLGVIKFIRPDLGPLVSYVFICVLSSILYVYFSLGFLKRSYNIAGIFLTTVFLTKYLSDMGSGPGWFVIPALPIIIWVFLNVLTLDLLFTHSNKKDRVGFMPMVALIASASICIGIDVVISFYIHNAVKLTWSLVVAASVLSVAFIMQTVIRLLPERLKNAISRKMHL